MTSAPSEGEQTRTQYCTTPTRGILGKRMYSKAEKWQVLATTPKSWGSNRWKIMGPARFSLVHWLILYTLNAGRVGLTPRQGTRCHMLKLRPGRPKNIDKCASQVVLVVKNPPANVGDLRDVCSTSGSGRSPGGGHGNPLQYSCLENPMDRGARQVTVHRIP